MDFCYSYSTKGRVVNLWNTWNILRLMNPIKTFQAPVNPEFQNATVFGRATMSKDTNMLCKTVHKAVAYYTGEGRALEDFFIIDIKATDSSGMGTGQSSDSAYGHKTRYTIYHKEDGIWETEHQGEIIGSESGYVGSPLHLITKPGEWKVSIDVISSGDCAEPTGSKNVGTMTALENNCDNSYRVSNEDGSCGGCMDGYTETEEGGDCISDDGDSKQGVPTNYNNLYMLGGGLLILGLVLKKK